MDKITRHISLGYTCTPKLYLYHINQAGEQTHIFDWVGTSMWSINELVSNGFQEMTDLTQIVKMKVITDQPEMMTHKKYYLRFFHDFGKHLDKISPETWTDFKEKYERRIPRFYELLQSHETILFWRLEEKINDKRIIYDDFQDKFQTTELEELTKFSQYLQNNYPGLKFHILYFNYEKDQEYDKENKIISLLTPDTIQYPKCKFVMDEIVKRNKEFINNCLL